MTETTTPPKKKPVDANLIPVRHVHFTTPIDFPGEQESNIRCLTEPLEHGKSYTGVYVKDLGCFDVTLYRQGAMVVSMLIPREQIKRWERA